MDKWQDPRTPVSVTQVGKYTVTIYDQEKYDESLRMYGDDAPTDRIKDAKDKKPLVQNFAQGVIPNNKSNASKPSFAKQKPAARWNWTHKLDQPLNVDQDLVRDFVEAREKEGHLFFWNDAAGFMHFPPTYGDTSCDTFIKKHKLAFDTFLQERKVKV